MTKYSKWDPDKVHMIQGYNGRTYPVIYNRNDKPITQYDAEHHFEASINTMHTWAARAFRLAIADTDSEMREYHLEHFEWKLDNIAVWLGSIRQALEEAQGKQREQEKIDKLLALAERTTFPAEAETARRLAAERQARADA
jgi:hypothetical protein